MKSSFLKLIMLGTFFFSAAIASAQSSDSLKAQLIQDWQRAKVYTKAYLDAMPADKYGHKPHDSIRSFAEQMLHLAQGNIGLSANGTGKERIFAGRNLERTPTLQNKDSLVYVVMASYDFCIEGIKNMDFSKADEKVKRGNFDVSRLGWVMKAFEHQTHHRGQCTIYIRLQGIKPPNEMLF